MNKIKITIEKEVGDRLNKVFPQMLKGDDLLLDCNAIENLGKLIRTGKALREAQDSYLRNRSNASVNAMKRESAAFDKLLKELYPLTERSAPKQNGLFNL